MQRHQVLGALFLGSILIAILILILAFYAPRKDPAKEDVVNVKEVQSVEYEVRILPPYPDKLTLVVSDTTIYVTSENARVRIIKNKNKE